MTADSDGDSERIGLESGAMDYVRKPFQEAVLVSRIQNILQNEARIRELQDEARIDHLTGLMNKSHSQTTLTDLCRNRSGALMMLDLDSFKLVNDLFGHAMGDQILIRFARIIQANIRPKDIAGRIGGDEFVVFCNNVKDPSVLRDRSARINQMLTDTARSLLGEDNNVPLGVSIGIVFVPDNGTEYEKLAQLADKALYKVKQNGKHGCAIYEEASSTADKPLNPSMRSVRMSLDERSKRNDGYELPLDSFRIIYRFLQRSMKNNHDPVQFVLFDIEFTNADSEDNSFTTDCFAENLGTSLRRSDVYCQSSSGQFLLLLPGANKKNGQKIITRILDNFSQTAASPKCSVTFEIEDIDSVHE